MWRGAQVFTIGRFELKKIIFINQKEILPRIFILTFNFKINTYLQLWVMYKCTLLKVNNRP
jgi:hypothetical protein